MVMSRCARHLQQRVQALTSSSTVVPCMFSYIGAFGKSIALARAVFTRLYGGSTHSHAPATSALPRTGTTHRSMHATRTVGLGGPRGCFDKKRAGIGAGAKGDTESSVTEWPGKAAPCRAAPSRGHR